MHSHTTRSKRRARLISHKHGSLRRQMPRIHVYVYVVAIQSQLGRCYPSAPADNVRSVCCGFSLDASMCRASQRPRLLNEKLCGPFVISQVISRFTPHSKRGAMDTETGPETMTWVIILPFSHQDGRPRYRTSLGFAWESGLISGRAPGF